MASEDSRLGQKLFLLIVISTASASLVALIVRFYLYALPYANFLPFLCFLLVFGIVGLLLKAGFLLIVFYNIFCLGCFWILCDGYFSNTDIIMIKRSVLKKDGAIIYASYRYEYVTKAIEELEKTGWKPSTDDQKAIYYIAKGQWDKCKEVMETARQTLLAITKNENADEIERSAAIAVLGEIGGADEIPVLVDFLKKDERLDLEAVAISSLVKLCMTSRTGASARYDFCRKNQLDETKCAFILYGLNRTEHVKAIATALESNDAQVRRKAVRYFRKVGSSLDIHLLVPSLQNWQFSDEAIDTLKQFGWNPTNDEDKIHYFVAKREGKVLKENWNVTKSVLLKDVESDCYSTVENALYAFTAIGRDEIIPVLIDKLNNRGNKTMAEAFLNCGNSSLVNAATEWADRNGYKISKGAGAHPVSWGAW